MDPSNDTFLRLVSKRLSEFHGAIKLSNEDHTATNIEGVDGFGVGSKSVRPPGKCSMDVDSERH